MTSQPAMPPLYQSEWTSLGDAEICAIMVDGKLASVYMQIIAHHVCVEGKYTYNGIADVISIKIITMCETDNIFDMSKADNHRYVDKLNAIASLTKPEGSTVAKPAQQELINFESCKDLVEEIRILQTNVNVTELEKEKRCKKLTEALITSLVYDIISSMHLSSTQLAQLAKDLSHPTSVQWEKADSIRETSNKVLHTRPDRRFVNGEREEFFRDYQEFITGVDYSKYFPFHSDKKQELLRRGNISTPLVRAKEEDVRKLVCDKENREHDRRSERKYKTYLCKNYPNCPYGAGCNFAHGEEELKAYVEMQECIAEYYVKTKNPELSPPQRLYSFPRFTEESCSS